MKLFDCFEEDTILWFIILFLLLFWNNGCCSKDNSEYGRNNDCGCGC